MFLFKLIIFLKIYNKKLNLFLESFGQKYKLRRSPLVHLRLLITFKRIHFLKQNFNFLTAFDYSVKKFEHILKNFSDHTVLNKFCFCFQAPAKTNTNFNNKKSVMVDLLSENSS